MSNQNTKVKELERKAKAQAKRQRKEERRAEKAKPAGISQPPDSDDTREGYAGQFMGI